MPTVPRLQNVGVWAAVASDGLVPVSSVRPQTAVRRSGCRRARLRGLDDFELPHAQAIDLELADAELADCGTAHREAPDRERSDGECAE